jgi:hypothetical protein
MAKKPYDGGLDTGYRYFVSQVCWKCKHLQEIHSCAAFPEEDGIPEEIWNGENDHRQPYPGDQGIQWEAK